MIRKLFKHSIQDVDEAIASRKFNPWEFELSVTQWKRLMKLYKVFENEVQGQWWCKSFSEDRMNGFMLDMFNRNIYGYGYAISFFKLIYYWHVIDRKTCRMFRSYAKRTYKQIYETL